MINMEKTWEMIIIRAHRSRGARMHLELHRLANSVMWSLALCII